MPPLEFNLLLNAFSQAQLKNVTADLHSCSESTKQLML